ncbi:MAG: hydrolase [Flavobacterium lindanitolerans]|nr:hydrolase [Flavobacterium lindanitolerans]PZO26135.1 MAG: hydrolase [Flavobacteriaceae bacterium]PZQ89415.1 MAG: hydrolase [Flavobacterium johnsoniae]THD34268.1 MAG: hydrolase [Flavobacterium johnsoniae]
MANFQKESKAKKDSIAALNNQVMEANYFSLEYNDNAMDYFEQFDINQLSAEIRDEINSLNEKPEGNPLTKYDKINGDKAIINKIKILNNRWIIADFSIGKAWGEVMIKYYKQEGKPTEYETMDTFIYPATLK